MRHKLLIGTGERKLSDPCEFCDAFPGEPCRNTLTKLFCCPDSDCDQEYEKRGDALRCVDHVEDEPSIIVRLKK